MENKEVFRPKQILKLYKNEKENALYGIYLGNGLFALENGVIASTEENLKSQNIDLYNIPYEYKTYFPDAQHFNMTAAHTRMVPEEIKSALLVYYSKLTKFYSSLDLFCSAKANLDIAKKDCTLYKEEVKKASLSSKGLLSLPDFLEEFKNNLSSDFIHDLESTSHIKHGYFGNEGEWESCITSNSIRFERKVWVDKYVGEASYTYREYDGSLHLNSKGESELMKMTPKYSSPLPIRNIDMREYFFIGDKESLVYSANYAIPLSKNLTKEYAASLAHSIDSHYKNKDTIER